jgi:hypothetical protein
MSAAKDWAQAYTNGADIHAAADREWKARTEDRGAFRGNEQFGATEAKSGNAEKRGAERKQKSLLRSRPETALTYTVHLTAQDMPMWR